jgi:branched-chain amino acid aminotransferase
MPEIDRDFVVGVIKRLVNIDARWVPSVEGTSLYIRPFMIATEAFLGVRPSKEYIFAIIMCPVGAYYPEGFNPVRIFVTEKYGRAARGGVGEAKTAGNYAASLMASEDAKEKGFTQVLWLDAEHHRNIEEVGTMNIFFVMDDKLVTPALSGSILPGITRRTVIELAGAWGIPVEERVITIDEVIDGISSGKLKECFGSGTAAVISPVASLFYKEKDYVVNQGRTGELAQKFFDEITGIQYGEKPDQHGWTEFLE